MAARGPTSRVMLPSVPLPLPSRDPGMCQEPTGLCQVGLYIGSVCNREGRLLFLLPPPHPLMGRGRRYF